MKYDDLTIEEQDKIEVMLNDNQELLNIQKGESLYEAMDRFLSDETNIKDLLDLTRLKGA